MTGYRPTGTARIVAPVVILVNAMSWRIREACCAGAELISVPRQLNYDQDIGPVDNGDRWLLNRQSVVQFSLRSRCCFRVNQPEELAVSS